MTNNLTDTWNLKIEEKKTSEKEIRLVVTGSGGQGKEEEWKGDQKVQTSSFKMNAYLDVTYNVMTVTNIAVWYIGKLLRE